MASKYTETEIPVIFKNKELAVVHVNDLLNIKKPYYRLNKGTYKTLYKGLWHKDMHPVIKELREYIGKEQRVTWKYIRVNEEEVIWPEEEQVYVPMGHTEYNGTLYLLVNTINKDAILKKTQVYVPEMLKEHEHTGTDGIVMLNKKIVVDETNFEDVLKEMNKVYPEN